MIGREADGVEGEDGVQHRRLDAAPLPVLVLMAEDPLDGARHGTAARSQEEVAGAHESRRRRGVAGEPQGEVCLDRRGEVPRAAGVDRPAALGLLQRDETLCHATVEVGLRPAEEAIEEDVLGLHGDVRLERRVPVAARVLGHEEVLGCARDRLGRAGGEALSVPAHQSELPFARAHAALPAAEGASTRTTIVRTPPAASVRATPSGSVATATTAPPAPPPVSLAPSAPARRALWASASTSGAETPSASSTAWFWSKVRPRASRSPRSATCTPSSTMLATSSKRRSCRVGSASQRARRPVTAAPVLRGRVLMATTSGSARVSRSGMMVGGSPRTKRKQPGPNAAAAGSIPDG